MGCNTCGAPTGWVRGSELESANESKRSAMAEFAALRKDAERYRWLRDEAGALSTFTAAYWNTSTPEQLDAAIDDAMAGD